MNDISFIDFGPIRARVRARINNPRQMRFDLIAQPKQVSAYDPDPIQKRIEVTP
jgi:hypothetical protein